MDGEEKMILDAIGGLMGHVGYALHFAPRGIELTQALTLN
jgi:hypothetical protein